MNIIYKMIDVYNGYLVMKCVLYTIAYLYL